MKHPSLEWKVGLFVVISLGVLGGLIMKFSKGAGLFTPTYEIHLMAQNVGGIIPGANVLMAGVPIGTIKEINLDADGRMVTMHARILSKFRIHRDAIFSIHQAGFLGDRFISVTPGLNKAPMLEDGDTVHTEEPFDIAELARGTTSLMKRAEDAIAQLSTAVARVDRTVLANNSLSNLTATLENFRILSDRALVAVENVNALVRTNTPALNTTLSNFSLFSSNLNQVAGELRETLATNRVELTGAMKNVQESSARVNGLISEVAEGKGLAGALLKNQELSTNVMLMVSNFNVFSSNLNQRGLWNVLRSPKQSSKK